MVLLVGVSLFHEIFDDKRKSFKMEVADNVIRSIDAFGRNDKIDALHQACIAVEGTARNMFSKKKTTRRDFKECIRKYWWLIEAFMGPGLNLEETKWTHLDLKDSNGKKIENPDLADIIYHIFRCHPAHGLDIPVEYQLLPPVMGVSNWILNFETKSILLPESVIWALLGIAVFSSVNTEIKSEGDYLLYWYDPTFKIYNFIIKDTWGKEDELKKILSNYQFPRVKLEGL
jgi:hypothetical protein